MRSFTIRWMLGIAAIAMVALVPPASARAASAATVQVAAKEFSFKLSTNSIARPGTVRFNVKNVGKMVHDFRINGKQTRMIQPGKTSTLVVTFKKKGHYHYLCTVPGHA